MNRKIFFMSALMLLSACGSPQTATPAPLQPYLDASASQATAVAAVATAEYFASHLTATVEAQEQSATQRALEAQAAATERAWLATATADASHATTVAAWTQRAMDITATADAAAVQAFATQQYAIARKEELALQRKEMVNAAAAITPWLGFAAAFITALFIFLRWSRVRVIPRDARGDAPLLLNVVDGVAYDIDRHPSSTGGVQREDLKRLPAFSAEHFASAAERDQMIDLAMRAQPRRRLPPATPIPSLPVDSAAPHIQVIDAAQAKPLFHDVVPRILQDAIEAEIISEGDAHE